MTNLTKNINSIGNNNSSSNNPNQKPNNNNMAANVTLDPNGDIINSVFIISKKGILTSEDLIAQISSARSEIHVTKSNYAFGIKTSSSSDDFKVTNKKSALQFLNAAFQTECDNGNYAVCFPAEVIDGSNTKFKCCSMVSLKGLESLFFMGVYVKEIDKVKINFENGIFKISGSSYNTDYSEATGNAIDIKIENLNLEPTTLKNITEAALAAVNKFKENVKNSSQPEPELSAMFNSKLLKGFFEEKNSQEKQISR